MPKLPTRRDGKLVVISLRTGRLANRLTLFAHFIALAEEQGHRLINFTFHSYADLYRGTRGDIYCRYPPAGRRSWMDVVPGVAPTLRKTRICYQMVRYSCLWNESFPIFGRKIVTIREHPWSKHWPLDGAEFQRKLREAWIVMVHGWYFRSPEEWMQRHAGKIRNHLRPVEPIERAADEAVAGLRKNADLVVGVHIRQGDYRRWLGGKYFFPPSRYAAWMQEFAAQFTGRKVAFFICSDEPRNSEEFPGLSVGLGAGSVPADLEALSQCDYIFGPVSTFSSWASFYGNKPLLLLESADARLDLQKFRVSWLNV